MNSVAFNSNGRSMWQRAISLMLAIAVFMCSGIFSASVGADTVRKLICDKEEHTHTDVCFEGVLICGIDADVEENEHIHSDECYAFGLICALEEHTHSDECYTEVETEVPDETPDETPDDDNFNGETPDDGDTTEGGDQLEGDNTPSDNEDPSYDDNQSSDDGFDFDEVPSNGFIDYTAYLPVGLTGNVCEDTFNIANFQIGVTEGFDGYTPYVAWLNEPYGAWDSVVYDEWNTAFAYFCLYHAGAESFVYAQYGVDIKSWVIYESGLFTTLYDGTPVRGDLVFIDSDYNGVYDRVGIFADMMTFENGIPLSISVIEGDVNGAVAVSEYDALQILGFADMGNTLEQGDPETMAEGSGTRHQIGSNLSYTVVETDVIDTIELPYSLSSGDKAVIIYKGTSKSLIGNDNDVAVRFYLTPDDVNSTSNIETVSTKAELFEGVCELTVNQGRSANSLMIKRTYDQKSSAQFDFEYIYIFYGTMDEYNAWLNSSMETNTIYYRVNGEGDYQKNVTGWEPNNLTVYVGDIIEITAIVESNTGVPNYAVIEASEKNLVGEKAGSDSGWIDIGNGRYKRTVSFEVNETDSNNPANKSIKLNGVSSESFGGHVLMLTILPQEIYEPNKIFYRVKKSDGTYRYPETGSSYIENTAGWNGIDVCVGDTIEVLAVVNDPILTNQGADPSDSNQPLFDSAIVNAPSGTSYTGFFRAYENPFSRIAHDFHLITDNTWKITATFTVDDVYEGQYNPSIQLFLSGTALSVESGGTIIVKIQPEERTYPQRIIHVKLPDGEILDKNAATKAQNGIDEPNSVNNPYVVYVGETLELITFYTPPGDGTKDESGYWGSIGDYFDYLSADGNSTVQNPDNIKDGKSVAIKLRAKKAGITGINANVIVSTAAADTISILIREPYKVNTLYYRVKDVSDKYIYGTLNTYLEAGDVPIDIQVSDIVEVYAIVDNQNFSFDFEPSKLEQIGDVKWEQNIDGQWVMSATYRVKRQTSAVSSFVSLNGTDASDQPVNSNLGLNIRPVEKYKIYYRTDSGAAYELNRTTVSDLLRMLDGEVVEVYAEVVNPAMDANDEKPLLGDRLGLFALGSEMALYSTLIPTLVDAATNTWRLTASFIATSICEQTEIELRVNFNPVDTLYVNIDFKPNTVYYRINNVGNFVRNYGNTISAYLDDVIELKALIQSNSQPDPAKVFFGFEGTYFDSINDVHIEPVEGKADEWYVFSTVKAKKCTEQGNNNVGGTTPINLITNDGVQNTLNVNIKEGTAIHVHNMKIGTMDYDYVDKNTATTMLTGDFTQNSPSNRYILFVGDTLDLSATSDGRFSVTDSSIFYDLGRASDRITPNNDSEIVISTQSYLALKPGECEIRFEEQVFYVSVYYPIYVATAMGNIHKNKVHESLELIYGTTHNEDRIADTNFRPIYLKNIDINNDDFKYWMIKGDTIELVAYAPISNLTCTDNSENHVHNESCFKSDTPNFKSLDNSIVTVENSLSVETIEGQQFVKVTAKVTSVGIGNVRVMFGDRANPDDNKSLEIFYIHSIANTNLHHFDIEIADGGTYTTVEVAQEIDENGNPYKRTVTEIIYSTLVTAVSGSEVYDGNGQLLKRLEEWEYWRHGIEGVDTQFEITSAYVTDEVTGKPPDENNPGVKFRNVPANLIKSVVFYLTLDITPLETKRTVFINQNDSWVAVDESNPNYSAPPNVEDVPNRTITDFVATMEGQQIIDAINKCPNHYGADFTLLTSQTFPLVTIQFVKLFNGGHLEENQFTFDLYEDVRESIPNNEKPNLTDSSIIKRRDQAKNNSSGIVKFNSREFIEEGIYTYYIVERPGTSADILYDQRLIKVEVKVERWYDDNLNDIYENTLFAFPTAYCWDDDSGGWVVLTDNIKFVNYMKFMLPVAGGEGTRQYIYFGGAITLIGFILLCKRKRREGSP